jgi:hypothetical protein
MVHACADSCRVSIHVRLSSDAEHEYLLGIAAGRLAAECANGLEARRGLGQRWSHDFQGFRGHVRRESRLTAAFGPRPRRRFRPADHRGGRRLGGARFPHPSISRPGWARVAQRGERRCERQPPLPQRQPPDAARPQSGCQGCGESQGTIFAVVYRRIVPRLGHARRSAISHRLCRLIWKILHERVRVHSDSLSDFRPWLQTAA